MATVTTTLGRGLGLTRRVDNISAGAPVVFGWSNGLFTTVTGEDFITALLQFLHSGRGPATATGSDANYDGSSPSYDQYMLGRGGVGMGIPTSRINVAAFRAIQNQYDWDQNLKYCQFFISGGSKASSSSSSASLTSSQQAVMSQAIGATAEVAAFVVGGPILAGAELLGETMGDKRTISYQANKYANKTFRHNMRRHHHHKKASPPKVVASPDPLTKDTLEAQLCRPVGCYLTVDNTGKITLIRPKNPMKFHVSKANQTLAIKVATGGTTYNASLQVGIYNPTEMCAEVDRALTAAKADNWTVTYSTSTNLFTVTNASNSWDLTTGNGWKTLGYTANVTNTASGVGLPSDTAVGAAPTTSITENDIIAGSIQQHDTGNMQITNVIYKYDYNLDTDTYRTQREWILSDLINIGAPLGSHPYVIESKGLHTSEATYNPSGLLHWTGLDGSCNSVRATALASSGVDYDSSTSLFAQMMLDRYAQPPICFDCKLTWRFNTLEMGDNVLLNYAVKDVFMDYELNTNVLTNRVFEVVGIGLDPGAGCVNVRLLGHRSSTTASFNIANATAELRAQAS